MFLGLRRRCGAPGIWRFDGTDTVQVHHESYHYVTELTDFDGALFAGTSDGWKDDVGTSSLLMSRDGSSWETVCDFPELAAWSIATSGDHLYVGTWQYGDGGQVYEVSIVEVPSDDDDDDTGTDVDCAAISAANPAWEVCETGPGFCAGVFTDGAGCAAYCAPAGLACTARFGGEPGCIKEPENVWDCAADNGHQSDWCECGDADAPPPPDPECQGEGVPRRQEQGFRDAQYQPRSSWVLQCRDYAYSAQFDEHEACDNQYRAGSGRGTATFSFNVAPGIYEVVVEGRHTENRNPRGALIRVNSQGQRYQANINQRDNGGVVADVAGRWCLGGPTEVIVDSSRDGASDSVRRVILVPR